MKKQIFIIAIVLLCCVQLKAQEYCIPASIKYTPYSFIFDFGELRNQEKENFNLHVEMYYPVNYVDMTSKIIRFHKNRMNQIECLTNFQQNKGQKFAIYADWNSDGVFNEVDGEHIMKADSSRNPTFWNYPVPAHISEGSYILRIRYADRNDVSLTPCDFSYKNGFTIDFTLEIAEWENPVLEDGKKVNGWEDGFEKGNHDLWGKFNGKHPISDQFWPDPDDINCCQQAVEGEFSIDASLFGNDPLNRFTVVSKQQDPNLTNFITVPEWGGNYAMRIGNRAGYGNADRILRSLKVDSSFYLLHFGYAVIMNEPGHLGKENPFFEMKVLDSDGRVISGMYEWKTNKFPATNVELWNWSNKTYDLRKYIGKDVTIQITVASCARGAHFGYAYFDYEFESHQKIKKSSLNICSGAKFTLKGVSGMEEYRWSTGETTREITMSAEEDFDISLTMIDSNQQEIVLEERIVVDQSQDCLGIVESSKSFLIYPNPTTDVVRIVNEKEDHLTVKVMNAIGVIEIIQEFNGTGDHILDLKQLAPAMYWVWIESKNERSIQSILKE